jgi:hypothetical protein
VVTGQETIVEPVDEVGEVEAVEESADFVSATVEKEDEDETSVDDELAEIETIMAETEADEAAEETTETVVALSLIQAQVVELSAVVELQGERIEKVTGLLLQQANQLQAISRNLRRLDGERIVTERVPLTNRQAVDGLETAGESPDGFVPPLHGYAPPIGSPVHGQPPTIGMRQFSSVIDGDPPDLVLASDTPNAVAEKAAERRVKRNQQYRMGTRK